MSLFDESYEEDGKKFGVSRRLSYCLILHSINLFSINLRVSHLNNAPLEMSATNFFLYLGFVHGHGAVWNSRDQRRAVTTLRI
jgi:hypothetical protein